MAINTSDEVGEPHADNSDRVVVKKTFRYSTVFFYNHLCRNSLFRNIIMESGIKRAGIIFSCNLSTQNALY